MVENPISKVRSMVTRKVNMATKAPITMLITLVTTRVTRVIKRTKRLTTVTIKVTMDIIKPIIAITEETTVNMVTTAIMKASAIFLHLLTPTDRAGIQCFLGEVTLHITKVTDAV